MKRKWSLSLSNGLILALLATSVVVGCVTNPKTGKKELTPLFEISTNATGQVTVATSPAVRAALEIVQSTNSSLNPTPSAPLINLGLTGLAAALGIWGSAKSRKANRKSLALSSVIRGVEAGTDDGTIKHAIQVASLAAGVAEDVHEAVKKTTGK